MYTVAGAGLRCITKLVSKKLRRRNKEDAAREAAAENGMVGVGSVVLDSSDSESEEMAAE